MSELLTITVDGACVIAEGTRNRDGYVVSWRGRKTLFAHRIAWEEANGPIPGGLCVLHRCDNPPCCNPAHLFLGTRSDNLRDMWAKGRGRATHANPQNLKPTPGESHWAAKLTEASVREMRTLRTAGWTGVALARRYAVSTSQVSAICRRQSWSHV